uniref:low molecular weight protein-tyrosine-phosphatase n=1 Tax=Gelidibacter sp. TaxID=2018083 RepID=UPI004049BEB3
MKILMVCLGNICRSPLAHGILESKLPQEIFYIDSAGTGNYHIGQQPDHRSIAVAKKNGIDISKQCCRQFTILDFDRFDIIYVMDKSNFENVVKLARTPEDIAKVKLILEENGGSKITEVTDPYYGDINDFESIFELLDTTSEIISKKLIRFK